MSIIYFNTVKTRTAKKIFLSHSPCFIILSTVLKQGSLFEGHCFLCGPALICQRRFSQTHTGSYTDSFRGLQPLYRPELPCVPDLTSSYRSASS